MSSYRRVTGAMLSFCELLEGASLAESGCVVSIEA